MKKVLVVDDDESFAQSLRTYLERSGHQAVTSTSLTQARATLGEFKPHVLILDLMLPDGNGLELLDDVSDLEQVLLVSGDSGITGSVHKVRGADVQYVTKPFNPAYLLELVESMAPCDEPRLRFGLMIGESEAMQNVYARIKRVADSDGTVFIQGESGTGKELVAEAVHESSGRAGRFVRVNCGGLTRELVSSQLFGHERGSFTGANRRHIGFFEQAENGTLFLDEITEMPIEMQTHLLRVLETGHILRVGAEQEMSVNFRLITATNRNPLNAVRDGYLREDLYYRLRVFPIELPPLRERREDVPLLAQHILDCLNEKYETERRFAAGVVDRLSGERWTGNVRDLRNIVHRLYLSTRADEIGLGGFLDQEPGAAHGKPLRVGRSIRDVEKDLILKTLRHFDGDRQAAAETLGVSVKTLYNRLLEYRADEEPDIDRDACRHRGDPG